MTAVRVVMIVSVGGCAAQGEGKHLAHGTAVVTGRGVPYRRPSETAVRLETIRDDVTLLQGGAHVGEPAATAHRARADARRNTEAVLQAATDVFATSGVDAPVREIAARAGVS